MIFKLKTVILTHVIYFSHCGPLDVQKKSHIILPQSGDPFNSFTGNFAAEESFIEQGIYIKSFVLCLWDDVMNNLVDIID